MGQQRGLKYEEFVKEYKDKFGIEPETYATYCYDTFMIAMEAIKRIPPEKNISSDSIRSELLKINDYSGVTGITTFNGSNNASGKTFDRMVVENGKFILWKR